MTYQPPQALPAFLKSLPRELLPRILINLDSFSLRALLLAYPIIAQHCIVLVEEIRFSQGLVPYPCCFFSQCEGLRRLPFAEYIPMIHKSLFKIYEVGGIGSVDPRLGMALEERLPYIGKRDSFVHYSSRDIYEPIQHNGFAHVRPDIPQETNISRVLRHGGYAFDTTAFRFPEVIVFSLDSPLLQRDCFYNWTDHIYFHEIRSLSLEGIERVESLTLPPTLQTLTIVFTKSIKNPVIKDLLFSTSDNARLMIFYYDRVPLIQGLQTAGDVYGGIPDIHHPTHNILALVHVPSMAGGLTDALPPHPDEGRDFSYLGSALEGQFESITITGGPNGIVGSINLQHSINLRTLLLKQTCQYPSLDSPRLTRLNNIDNLTTISFESLLENPVIPSLVCPNGNQLTMLSITTHHGIDLSQLLLGMTPATNLKYVYINVASQNSDFVSSIDVLSPVLEPLLAHEPMWGTYKLMALEIVGLKKSLRIDMEALKRRVSPAIYSFHQCNISLID